MSTLASYGDNGLPKMPDLIVLGRPVYDKKLFNLEKHWSDIVGSEVVLDKYEKAQQEALWELLLTEVEYIEKLRVILDVSVLRGIGWLVCGLGK